MQAVNSPLSVVDPDALEQALSHERFGRYVLWANGDRSAAIRLYALNIRYASCLYIPLQTLEITLRNRIHNVLSQAGDAAWYDSPNFQKGHVQSRQLADAKAKLQSKGKPVEPAHVVSALTFGYWTAFFGNIYEDEWRRSLHRIATTASGKFLARKQFAVSLSDIRELRNRIAHHESILMRNLVHDHRNIMTLTEWLSPAAATWCRTIDEFEDLHRQNDFTTTLNA